MGFPATKKMAYRDLNNLEDEFLGLVEEETDFGNQTIPISPYQVKNQHGGYVFKESLEKQLYNFICTGSSSQHCRSRSSEILFDDAACVSKLIQDGRGKKVVDFLLHLQQRIYRQGPLLFVLAMCCRSSDTVTKRAGYNALPSICRIPTHLFKFLNFCQVINEKNSLSKGWGRAHRKAVCDWYHSYGSSEANLKLLALHITKYSKRHGWRHKNVMRLAHLKIKDEEDPALRYLVIVAVKGKQYADSTSFMKDQESYQWSTLKKVRDLISSIETAKHAKDVVEIPSLILRHKIEKEHIPTNFLNDKQVWLALMRHMSLNVLIRNLGKISMLKIFKPSIPSDEDQSFEECLCLAKLQNKELIDMEGVHPLTYMVAINQYKKGKNRSESLHWPVCPHVCTALEAGLYLSFKNFRPLNQRILVALDISKSMEENVNRKGSSSLQALDVAAVMLSMSIKTAENCHSIVFSTNRATDLPVKPTDDLQTITDTIKYLRSQQSEGSADASLPIVYAIQNKKNYDAFIIYTDSNATSGNQHPAMALKSYRQMSGNANAKLVICNMICSDVSVGDPNDPLTLTVCGLDSDVPQMISNFVNCEL